MVSAEQKEYAEVFDYSKITEKSGVITDYWTNNLLELILRRDNLNNAYKQVRKNKGKGGIDGMQVDELLPFLRENQESLIQEIREGKYKPNPVLRVNTRIVVHHLKLEGRFNVGNMKISLLMFINQHWKTITFIDRDDAS